MHKHEDFLIFGLKLINMSHFHPLEVVGPGTQLKMGGNLKKTTSSG